MVNLASFNARAERDVAAALRRLEAAGVTELELDLRDNRCVCWVCVRCVTLPCIRCALVESAVLRCSGCWVWDGTCQNMWGVLHANCLLSRFLTQAGLTQVCSHPGVSLSHPGYPCHSNITHEHLSPHTATSPTTGVVWSTRGWRWRAFS